MRITESRLRRLIRSVIKETYDHVGQFAVMYMMPKSGISTRDLKNLCPSRAGEFISIGDKNSYDDCRSYEGQQDIFKEAFLSCIDSISIGQGNDEVEGVVRNSGFIDNIMPLKVCYDNNDPSRLMYCTVGEFKTVSGTGHAWFSLPKETFKFERKCNHEFGQINSSSVEYDSMLHSRDREEQAQERDRLARDRGEGVYANPYSGESEAENRARIRSIRDDEAHRRKIRGEMF